MFKLLRVIILLIASFVAEEVRCSTCGSTSVKEPQCLSSSVDNNVKHINIVFFGATGNLAKKYLWQSLFEVYKNIVQERHETKFSIYAASREEPKEGRQVISNILLNLEKCLVDECQDLKKGFVRSARYVRVMTVEDYQKLENLLDENTQSMYGMLGSSRTNEVGRLFYLAIPPSAYGATAQKIHKYLMPKIGKPWVRLVIEKPFGSDIDTAVKLNDELLKSFDESQIYRLDHYLGKTVLNEVLPFRITNADKYNHMWNSEYVERVEVVFKEEEDVVGRTWFYNENGILRDVMQNHMTEMLAIVAMELPTNGGSSIDEIHKLKLELISKMKPSKNESSQIILGQYSTYNDEWLSDTKGTNQVTDVPTFAATAFYVDNERWRGVPFVLHTGKKLDEKSSFVRILFKDNHICPSGKTSNCKQRKQLVFYIGGQLGEGIAVSPGLPLPEFKPNWREQKNPERFVKMFCHDSQNLRVFSPDKFIPPYTQLIQASIEAARHLFVPTNVLYQSWKFWTPLIESSSKIRPRKYHGGSKDMERLEFLLLDSHCDEEGGVRFANSEQMVKAPMNDV